ncbi:MAG: threonine synthase [Polyangiaceae bacterium]|nr:threonine synthase [Polyangiaceae bacterium]
MFLGYACRRCGGELRPDEATYRCPRCDGNLDVRPDFGGASRDAISASRDPSLWRYAPLLPVPVPAASAGPLRGVGGTPLYAAPRVAAKLGVARVWLKDEGRMPTASLKDRASAVVVQRAQALGLSPIITASTGNAGVALAAMAPCAGIEPVILVPASAPPAKIAQLQIFGARLVLVRGSYDDAFALSEAAARELGWYCRNTAQNPFTTEGKKTVSFEIAEQLGWKAPDRVFVSVGDGNILVGVHKGFRELVELGFIERMPKIMGVQAEGSSPIARAFLAGSDHIEPCETHTLADSIAAGKPADGERALAAVRETGGAFVIVSDEQILAAIATLGRTAQVFAEPAAAAAYAGAELTELAADEEIVVLVTGNGLKDIGAATRAAKASPPVIEPSLAALSQVLKEGTP